MSLPYYLVIQGTFVIVGKEPDADSVRFIADNPDFYQYLKRADRIKPSRGPTGDGSVQLRFEAVDAPEVHYGKAAQPVGTEARDQLLGWMGFSNVKFEDPNRPNRVTSADPADGVRGAILSKGVDANGRPISYVLLEADVDDLQDGEPTRVDEELLPKTLNHRLLGQGMAYYTVYTSTPAIHRWYLRDVAAGARGDDRGVWELNATSNFELNDQDSIGPNGQLILPKLFRRCTDYLKAVEKGFMGNLVDWMIEISATPSRSENDRVLIDESIEVNFSDLIEQRNRQIAFQADLLNIVFVEK